MAKKTRGEGGGLSLRTKDATSGGGTEGALATIREINWVDEFTYGGRQKDNPQAALSVVYDIDGFDKSWDDNYTAGPSDKYEVIADGDGIKSLGKATGLNKKCKAHFFFEHLEAAAEEAGLDLDELLPELDEGGNSVRPLEGMRVRLTNKPFTAVNGDTKDTVVIGSFVASGEEAPKSKGKSNGKTGGNGKVKASSDDDDIEEATEQAVLALIEEHTSVKKGDLANLIYQADRKNPTIKAQMNLCFKDAWVSSDDRPWAFNKKTGKLTAKDDAD